eukprot:12414202-Karenia_brevis.AAC.1
MRHKHTRLATLLGVIGHCLLGSYVRNESKYQKTDQREGVIWIAPRKGVVVDDVGGLMLDANKAVRKHVL